MLQNLITTQNLFLVAVVISWLIVLQILQKRYPNSERLRVGKITVTLETRRGKKLFNYLSNNYGYILRPLGTAGVLMTVGIMIVGSLFFFVSAVASLRSPESVQSISTSNYLLIPGVNDYLPLSVAVEVVLAVFIAMALHEGAHAVYCRLGDIEVESSGLAFIGFLPVGAFVRPNETEIEIAKYTDKLRMFAAGILSNMVSSIIFILLFIVITSQLVVPAFGVPVSGSIDGSPADESGITSTQITSVNDTAISSQAEFQEVIENSDDVSIQTAEGETHTFSKQLSVQRTITQVTDLPVGSQVQSINGESVTSVNDFTTMSQNSEELTLTTQNNEEYTVPVGAAIILNDGSYHIVQSVEENKISTGEEFSNIFANSSEEVTITTSEGEIQTLERDQVQQVYQGVSGLSVTDTGLIYTDTSLYEAFFYPFENDTSVSQWIGLFVIFPLLTLIGGGGTDVFYGFADQLTQYYTITGGDPMFFLANVLYWTAWISVNLAVFNALPLSILDGGRMAESTVEKLATKYSLSENAVQTIMYSIYLFVGVSLLVMLILPVVV